jgi:hypothetical protein
LYDQNDLVYARAHRVHSDHVTLLVFAVNAHQPGDEQLAPVKAVVLPSRYYRSNYSSKKHDQLPVASGQLLVVSG